MAKIAAALNGEPTRAPSGAVAFPGLAAFNAFVDEVHEATRPVTAMARRMERQLAEIRPALDLPRQVALHRNMSAAARAHGLLLGRLTMRQLTDILTWEGDAGSLAERTALPADVCAVLLAMARGKRSAPYAGLPLDRRPLLTEPSPPRYGGTAARPVHRGIAAPPWRLALVRSVQTAAPPVVGAGAGRSV